MVLCVIELTICITIFNIKGGESGLYINQRLYDY